MKVNVVGIPLHYGCDRFGVEKGPQKLRENGLIDILKSEGNEVYDLGDLVVPERPASEKYEEGTTMKWLTPITKANENLAQVVYSSLQAGAFALSVGGDHAMGLGTVAGSSMAYGEDDLAVFWIDAHGDINTAESSPSGNIHGMPLGALMGFGDQKLKDIYFEGRKVKPENVYLLCQRDLDPGEVELIKNQNIKLWNCEDIRAKGINGVMDEVMAKFNESGINNIHISFDIDSMDCNIVPGTGTPVADGMTVHDAETMLWKIFESGKVRALDFTEYNPGLEYETTTDNCVKVLKAISKSLAEIK